MKSFSLQDNKKDKIVEWIKVYKGLGVTGNGHI